MPEPIEGVTLVVDGREWHAWSAITITRKLDSFSTVEFEAPFEPERELFRQTFQPFSFKVVQLHVGDELVFTGRLVGVDPRISADSRTIQASCYALPAVLNDCVSPASAYPLELNGLHLRAIAETLCRPFSFDVRMDVDDGAPFRRVRPDPDQEIFQFLTDLAQQRGLVMTDDPDGALRFLHSASIGSIAPVAVLREGEPPLESVQASFSPQSYFSEITGLGKTRHGRAGARYTVPNPFLPTADRPHAFQLEDTDGPDVPAATRAKLGRMFGNVLAIDVEVPTWRDPQGALWKPNTLLRLLAPSAMVLRESTFEIREATFHQDAESLKATLNLVLPGAFSGEIPTELPWV